MWQTSLLVHIVIALMCILLIFAVIRHDLPAANGTIRALKLSALIFAAIFLWSVVGAGFLLVGTAIQAIGKFLTAPYAELWRYLVG